MSLCDVGIILRANDTDLYPSAEKDPYSDTVVYLIIAFCQLMVLVLFVWVLRSFSNTSDRSPEEALAHKIVEAAAENFLNSETWKLLRAEAEAKMESALQSKHPAVKLLTLIVWLIEHDEWCGEYVGPAGKEDLVNDFKVASKLFDTHYSLLSLNAGPR